jgi:nucleotide-binding universal stress UspA family protein
MSTSKMVVGLDGSEASTRAVAWCAEHAAHLGSEVVVVHAIDLPILPGVGFSYMPVPSLTAAQHEELRDVVSLDWCKPLADAGVRYRVVLVEGTPAEVIMETARAEGAELIVTGRRGRGGFVELILGSTSHALTHLADRPLVVVP